MGTLIDLAPLAALLAAFACWIDRRNGKRIDDLESEFRAAHEQTCSTSTISAGASTTSVSASTTSSSKSGTFTNRPAGASRPPTFGRPPPARDRGYKHALYARHGVAEYWLVDPVDETIAIHRLRGGALVVAHTFGHGQTLRSPLLAGFALDLRDVFPS